MFYNLSGYRMNIADYEKLIFKIAHRYKSVSNLEFSDLVQLGYLGLLRADNAYDESKDTKFITLAYICIKNSIVQSVIKENRHSGCCLNDEVNQDHYYTIDRYDNKIEIDRIKSVMQVLNETEKKVIELRYLQQNFRSFRKIGELCNFTDSRAEQIEKAAIKKLKEAYRNDTFKTRKL